MSRHSFDPSIAADVGINAAVIYQNIIFWCEKNAANVKNVHDGMAWTYNSRSAMEKLFPYLTPKQIRTAIDKLEEVGLIVAGSFNKDARDRTKWYAVPALGRLEQMPSKEIALAPEGQSTLAPEGQPLPDRKPDVKIPPYPQGGSDLFSADSEEVKKDPTPDLIEKGFEEFWNEIWPAHSRKTGRITCLNIYKAACIGKHPKANQVTPADLNAATRRYIASVSDKQYLKAPLAWLRLPGWEPFLGSSEPVGEPKRETYARRVLREEAERKARGARQ